MFISAYVTFALLQGQATSPARQSSISGEVRVHQNFESRILGNKRNISVYLPPDYDAQPKKKYPVLYMHDGQNIFDGMTSYIPNAEWRADESAEMLIRAGLIQPLIIVGIDNAQMDRANEYLPTRNNNMGGRAKEYGRFLTEEVMPFVQKTYRVRTDAKSTALAGSSFGGVITCVLGMQYPDRFGSLALVSPSVWWDDRVLLKLIARMPKKTAQRIWIDMGTKEGQRAVADATTLAEAYESQGWHRGKDLWLVIENGAEHNEPSWARRMGEILITLFRK
jgi:predicted alpha/beta superfamily hydrolase